MEDKAFLLAVAAIAVLGLIAVLGRFLGWL
jgi:hypothetical protein